MSILSDAKMPSLADKLEAEEKARLEALEVVLKKEVKKSKKKK
jgi:hypothetical protein